MLRVWRERDADRLYLDLTPTGSEEDDFLFGQELDSPKDLNSQILAERQQDMGERILFADRAFLVTLVWVLFLVALTFLQMVFSIWGHGLSDSQFVTVVTTTTASVFGFWYLVGKYLHREN